MSAPARAAIRLVCEVEVVVVMTYPQIEYQRYLSIYPRGLLHLGFWKPDFHLGGRPSAQTVGTVRMKTTGIERDFIETYVSRMRRVIS